MIYASGLGSGFNGYCQLPPDSPDLILAKAFEAHENSPEEVERRYESLREASYVVDDDMARRMAERPRHTGYDILQDLAVHGGLTYGPDDEGWIGFDTGHGWDDWSDEELRLELCDSGDEELWLHFQEMALLLNDLPSARGEMWPPGRMAKGDLGYRLWTMDDLIAETNTLAAQIAVRHQDLLNLHRPG